MSRSKVKYFPLRLEPGVRGKQTEMLGERKDSKRKETSERDESRQKEEKGRDEGI